MHSQDHKPPLLIYPEHSGEHIQPSQDSGSHTLQENLRQGNNDLDVIGNDVHVIERGRQDRPRHAKTSGATDYEHPRAAKSGRAFHNNTKREIGNQAFQKRAIPLQDFHKNMETPQTFQERDIPLQAFQKRGVEKPQAFRKREIPHKRDIRSGGSGEHSPDSNYYVEDTNTDHKRTIDIDNGSPSDIRNIDYYYASGEVNSNEVMQDEEEYDDGEHQEDLEEEVETLLDLKRTGPKARTGGIKGIHKRDIRSGGSGERSPDSNYYVEDTNKDHKRTIDIDNGSPSDIRNIDYYYASGEVNSNGVMQDEEEYDDGEDQEDLEEEVETLLDLKRTDDNYRVIENGEEALCWAGQDDTSTAQLSSSDPPPQGVSPVGDRVEAPPVWIPDGLAPAHHPTNQNSNQHYPTNQNSNQHYPTNQNSNTYPILERSNQPEDFQPMEARDGESNLNATNETRPGDID
ncbi:uncharacterized protein LOC113467614 [Diaphorina citri]|uniref:Uncharacterized protein LOC113467614 n=1 Tax=Diaphorina citri TaxID=121845 RepID=A0A3Q0IZ05_DIACI|nr:uncharacterized protein LOC113467614 [Diaphorina citri]